MYKRPLSALSELQDEIIYLDEITGDERTGIVVMKEQIADNAVMVLIASPYDDENIHEENGIKYKDIMVFDDISNDINGWGRDPIVKEYGKFVGLE